MSNSRRMPKPRWHKIAAIAAGVIVVAGGGALAVAAGSGGSGGGQSAGSTLVSVKNGDAQPPATRGAMRPAGTPSGTVKPTAGGSASATPSGKATATSTASAGTTPTTPPRTTAPPSSSHPSTVSVFTGTAFDTCTAPSLSKMTAWHGKSPYGAAAVYVGGRNRGCAQPQLTASWVRSVSTAGWKLIPIYVGAQPPCQTSGNPERITAATAASLGTTDGADAVAKAQALGMRSGSAVYLDMEAYDTSNKPCVSAVLTYIQAWDRAAHARGYWAGFYGFTSSSAAAIAAAHATTPDLPDALWYAKYDGTASTTTGFPFSAGLWTGHRRGHQYLVNQKETYGGVTLTVDRDAWDAPVAVV